MLFTDYPILTEFTDNNHKLQYYQNILVILFGLDNIHKISFKYLDYTNLSQENIVFLK